MRLRFLKQVLRAADCYGTVFYCVSTRVIHRFLPRLAHHTHTRCTAPLAFPLPPPVDFMDIPWTETCAMLLSLHHFYTHVLHCNTLPHWLCV